MTAEWVEAHTVIRTPPAAGLRKELIALYERAVEWVEEHPGPFTNKEIHHALGGNADEYACALAATNDLHAAGLLRRVSRPRTRPYVYVHGAPMGGTS